MVDAHPHPSRGIRTPALLCRAGTVWIAFRTASVSETLRRLPIEPLRGMPAFVIGAAVIRGAITPVVDARTLLGVEDSELPARLVVLRLGERAVAVGLDEVVGLRELDQAGLAGLPPLLRGAASEAVAEIGRLDGDLLVVLDAGRVVPESAWRTLAEQGRGT